MFVIFRPTRCCSPSCCPPSSPPTGWWPGPPRTASPGSSGCAVLMRSFDEWHIGNDLQTGQVGWKVVSETLTRPPHHRLSCLARFWWNLSHMWDVGVELGWFLGFLIQVSRNFYEDEKWHSEKLCQKLWRKKISSYYSSVMAVAAASSDILPISQVVK